MPDIDKLLEGNKHWAQRVKAEEPKFFERQAAGQNPDYLWIGCSDSRVPSNVVVDVQPGELFVHRNIANVVSASDLSVQSVIQYAVGVLEVEHVIVCGHYGCGGVGAVMDGDTEGVINQWLQPIESVYKDYRQELEQIDEDQARYDRLCELNVIEQVRHVAESRFVRQAWKNGKKLKVHGLIYSLQNGLLKDLEITESGQE